MQFQFAVDGSAHEEEIELEFPSATTLFPQIAGVLVDVDELRKTRHRFADPAAQIDAQDGGVCVGLLPELNLVSVDDEDQLRAFRREIHLLFAETEVNGRRLIDILDGIRSLIADDSDEEKPKCTTCGREIDLAELSKAGAPCPTEGSDDTLWLTDALRIHEAFKPYEPNLSAATRPMLVREHPVLLGFGRFVMTETPAALGNVGFVSDGPLAIFAAPSRWRRTETPAALGNVGFVSDGP